jgi:hypothetical protein
MTIRLAAIARRTQRADAARAVFTAYTIAPDEARDIADTARLIIATDGTPNGRADRDADAIDLAYYIIGTGTHRGPLANVPVSPWVRRALASTLPPKDLGR